VEGSKTEESGLKILINHLNQTICDKQHEIDFMKLILNKLFNIMKHQNRLFQISIICILLIGCDSGKSNDPNPLHLAFVAGYPKIVEYSQENGSAVVKVNKESTIYFIVQSSLIQEPSLIQVKEGKDGENNSPIETGQLPASPDSEIILDFDNLIPYDDHLLSIVVDDGETELHESLTIPNKLNLAVENAKKVPHLFTLTVNINGEIIKEEYLKNIEPDSAQDVRSVTKGILAILVGQAIEEGYFNVQSTLNEFLPEQYKNGISQEKLDITVWDFLTMSTGLGYQENEFAPWTQEDDEIVAILSRDLVSPPGTVFNYSTPNLQLLSVIFQEATGQTLHDFARERLFSSLEITNSYWISFETGYDLAGGFSFIPARGMMNIGLMVMNDGEFNGEQVVSKQFINDMLTPHFVFNSYLTTGPNAESKWFGYLWWDMNMAGLDGYMTSGYGGQNIIVFPEKELVITTSSEARVNGPTASQQQIDVWTAVSTIVESLE
jgi:CubicO group peptidase (beta-lactamase class C family)